MAPPPPIVIDAQAVSLGITGLSLACWIIVFAPQIYENFRQSFRKVYRFSLSFFSLPVISSMFLGSILQEVLPTMIILAITHLGRHSLVVLAMLGVWTWWKCRTPFTYLQPTRNEDVCSKQRFQEVWRSWRRISVDSLSKANQYRRPIWERSALKTLVDCPGNVAGLVGWYISYVQERTISKSTPWKTRKKTTRDPWLNSFGWLCAVFYLGSRIPQILLNYQRKSCEGISFMFFLFACLSNLTYVLSILPRYQLELLVGQFFLARRFIGET